MKQIKKLAIEAYRSNEAPKYNFCCGCHKDFDLAFEAGFHEAKALALDALYDSDVDVTGHGANMIREIGEEEA